MRLFLFILGLLLISGIAGLLPVFSWVLIDNSLIINTIHFCRSYAFAGSFCGGWGMMFVLIIGKLLADIMNGGLWGYGSIDDAMLMPQKVRQCG
jgi:hypothetical protein